MRAIAGVGLLVVLSLGCAGSDGRDPGDSSPPVLTIGPATSSGGSEGSTSSTSAADGITTSGVASSSSSGTVDPGTGDASTGVGETTGGGGPVVPACPGPADPLDCSPGPGSGEGDTCVDDPSCFLNLVKMSVNGVIADYPEWFDQSSGQPFVLEVELYMDTVVERVGQTQCSIRDPNAGDEIVVKHDNDFAENFDILTAEGFARYGNGIYTSKCIPAWF